MRTTMSESDPVVDTDPVVEFDAAFLAAPYAAFADLRERGPVHRASAPDGAPIWLVTRWDEVRALAADPRLSVDKRHSTSGYRGFSLPPELDANLLNLDGPDHRRLRRLVSTAFSPRRVQSLRPRIRELAEQLLDAIEESGRDSAEVLADYASPLPIAVICELLGVPERDRVDFKSWTDLMLAPSSRDDVGRCVAFLQRYLLDLVVSKRSEPADDLLSDLIAARDESSDRLSENELVSAAFLLLFAGYENTANLLGNGLAALLSRPGTHAALRDDPGLLPTAVEEFLRFDPPPQLSIRRFTTEDVEIGGVTVPAGETVMLAWASANRDPAHLTDPDSLQLDRGSCPHFSFGHGPHFCLGAALARAEVEIALEALLRRFPDLALAVPAEQLSWRESFRNRGLRELPVALR